MAYPAYIRDKARRMRELGMTLPEIAERLGINKTTIWYWISDIEVEIKRSPAISRRQHEARLKGNASMQRKYAALRDAAYREGWQEYDRLIATPTFRDFLCMYVGEGYKRSRNRVSLANSDPRVIALADRWMRSLATNPVTYWLQYHADQDPDELRRFWSTLLGCSPAAVRIQRKSNSAQLHGRTWRSRWGVLSVTAGDTMLRARLQAWLDRLQDEWLDSTAAGV